MKTLTGQFLPFLGNMGPKLGVPQLPKLVLTESDLESHAYDHKGRREDLNNLYQGICHIILQIFRVLPFLHN